MQSEKTSLSNSCLKIRRSKKDQSFLNDPLLNLLFNYYQEKNKGVAHFSIPTLPKSLNHQYGKGKNKHTGKTSFWLKDEIKVLRALCKAKLKNIPMKHFGISHAIIVFESPQWITLKNTVRKMDADNKIKPLFDAIEGASGFRDEHIFAFHPFKIVGQTKATHVWIFNMGDIVDCY